ncbi:MAG: hypothetical protein J7M40_03160 [Planctomycetes bacterium]|nr:hypothetical protein [Planctomycetota bacterium]
MNTEILAFGAPGGLELIIVSVLFIITWILPIAVVIYVIRLLIKNKQENQRLRLEVGKLADELQRMRKQNE